MIKLSKEIVITVVVVIILIVGLLYFYNKKNQTSSTDLGGPPILALVDKDSALQKSTTARDYFLIKDSLLKYLQKLNVPLDTKVVVSNVTSDVGDGSKKYFIISIPILKKENIKVIIDYAADPVPTLSIPSDNFTIPLRGGQS